MFTTLHSASESVNGIVSMILRQNRSQHFKTYTVCCLQIVVYCVVLLFCVVLCCCCVVCSEFPVLYVYSFVCSELYSV